MLLHQSPRTRWPIRLAFAVSLILHGVVLFLVPRPPTTALSAPSSQRLPTHMDARLAAPRAQAPAAAAAAAPAPPPPKPAKPPASATPKPQPAKPQEGRKIIAMPKSGGPAVSQATTPKFSVAEKEEMNRFLGELDSEAKAEAKSRPSLAERSMAMAREFGKQQGRPDDEGVQIVERLPNSPPIDPFSLEMYFDSLVKKLNRSAQFVRNDPRSKGVRNASLVIRLNPNGSLRTFQVLEAGDQQEEIAFIKSVVDQAVPFSPFPADILRSAGSLAMVICIRPTHSSDGGFGFSRLPNGRGC